METQGQTFADLKNSPLYDTYISTILGWATFQVNFASYRHKEINRQINALIPEEETHDALRNYFNEETYQDSIQGAESDLNIRKNVVQKLRERKSEPDTVNNTKEINDYWSLLMQDLQLAQYREKTLRYVREDTADTLSRAPVSPSEVEHIRQLLINGDDKHTTDTKKELN